MKICCLHTRIEGFASRTGVSDDESICDESAGAKASYFHRHSYFYVLKDKPDVGGKWREIHMPVIDTQLGTSGQLLIDWVPVYRVDLSDGRSTQPSFNPPAGCEVYANGQLTQNGRENTELRCTRLAPLEAGSDHEAERLFYLKTFGSGDQVLSKFPYGKQVGPGGSCG